jgi:hypothetical protein
MNEAGTALTVSGLYQSTYLGGVMDTVIVSKPCRTCGGTNRGPGGKCRDCERLREEVKRRLAGIKPKEKYVGPCKKCGSNDSRPDGTCRHCVSEYRKGYYKANKEKLLLASKAWVEKNRERSREIRAKWLLNNPEKQKQASKNWYLNNKDKSSEIRKKWRVENNSRSRTFCINRRRKMAGGKLSKDIVEILMAKQKGKCACCFKPLKDDFHLDHRMPIALGGENIDANMQLLHSVCNLKKNAKHPIDYMQELGLLL